MLNELALFAGAGGGILGGHLLGWRTVCAVECNAYAASVLVARQNDGTLAPFPIWDDVCTFDGRPWRGRVDVLSGGFPCQDISSAGQGAGIDGARSGLWAQMARIIGEVRPRFVLVENSPMLTSRGLGRVLGDLAAMGYDARWGVLGACDAGAPHQRERIWILAYAREDGWPWGRQHEQPADLAGTSGSQGETWHPLALPAARGREDVASEASEGASLPARNMAHAPQVFGDGSEDDTGSSVGRPLSELGDRAGAEDVADSAAAGLEGPPGGGMRCEGSWWEHEPDVGRVADGVAARVDRLAALGNGQVPAVVRLAWRALISERSGA